MLWIQGSIVHKPDELILPVIAVFKKIFIEYAHVVGVVTLAFKNYIVFLRGSFLKRERLKAFKGLKSAPIAYVPIILKAPVIPPDEAAFFILVLMLFDIYNLPPCTAQKWYIVI